MRGLLRFWSPHVKTELFADPIQISKGATYACSGAACVLAFVNTNAAAIGVGIAFLTFLANLFFHVRRDRREQAQWDGKERRKS